MPSKSKYKNVADVPMKYTGKGTRYVPGYAAQDIVVTQEEADMLSNSGIYEVVEPEPEPEPAEQPAEQPLEEGKDGH